jgi:hypothetical protein
VKGTFRDLMTDEGTGRVQEGNDVRHRLILNKLAVRMNVACAPSDASPSPPDHSAATFRRSSGHPELTQDAKSSRLVSFTAAGGGLAVGNVAGSSPPLRAGAVIFKAMRWKRPSRPAFDD